MKKTVLIPILLCFSMFLYGTFFVNIPKAQAVPLTVANLPFDVATLLKNAGIEVVRGCSGIPEEVVKQYIAGSVIDSGESCKTHEEHHGQANENKHICNH